MIWDWDFVDEDSIIERNKDFSKSNFCSLYSRNNVRSRLVSHPNLPPCSLSMIITFIKTILSVKNSPFVFAAFVFVFAVYYYLHELFDFDYHLLGTTRIALLYLLQIPFQNFVFLSISSAISQFYFLMYLASENLCSLWSMSVLYLLYFLLSMCTQLSFC